MFTDQYNVHNTNTHMLSLTTCFASPQGCCIVYYDCLPVYCMWKGEHVT